jgi:hypothetical protein
MEMIGLSKNVPIYDNNSELSLPSLVDSYGVTRQLFSDISGVSISRLSRSGPVSPKIRVQVSELVSIYMMLWKITKGDKGLIKRWLHEPQDEYFGLSPVQFMKINKENVATVLKNLHEIKYGEAMGS